MAAVMARSTSMRSRTARWLVTGMSNERDRARILAPQSTQRQGSWNETMCLASRPQTLGSGQLGPACSR